METKAIIEQIRAVSTPEEMEMITLLIRQSAGQMPADVQLALLDKVAEVTRVSKEAREAAISVLKVHGVEYPLTDWLTPKNYAKRFDLKSGEVVLNWINRGIIPDDHIKEIPELGLRLVKAVEYSPRAYKAQAKDAS